MNHRVCRNPAKDYPNWFFAEFTDSARLGQRLITSMVTNYKDTERRKANVHGVIMFEREADLHAFINPGKAR